MRLFLTVTVALVPIAVLSILQGMERARIDVANARQRLVQSARVAASDEENTLASAEQILRALANIDDIRNATPNCDRVLSDALIGVRFFVNLARISREGIVVCSALRKSRGMDVNVVPLFQAAKRTMAFSVSGQFISPVTRGPVIGAMLPLRDARGAFQGTVSVGVDARWLDHILKSRDLPDDAVVSVFDRAGTTIATNNPAISHAIFSRMPRAETLRGGFESRPDANGMSWTFAAAPLVGNSVFVGFALREAQLFGPTYFRIGTDFLLPIFMIGLAWAAIWIATDRQITRWIVYLRRVASAYRGGRYGVRPKLDGAPAEFKLLANAMESMAVGIQERDRSLRDAIVQKDALIRETHHRVKNNLQIVMSLLSLQAAQLEDPSVRVALSHAQARINALALVHSILHEVEDQTTVDLRRMLTELTRQIAQSMGGADSDVAVGVEVVQVDVPGEIAVPLALFTVEALINIFKHAFPPARKRGAVTLVLQQREGGDLRLAIEDDGVGFAAAEMQSGIGGRLLRVFAGQVHGTVSLDSEPGRGTVVELVFANPDGDARESAAPVAT